MMIGIVGSRSRTDKKNIENFVASLPLDCTVISGGCRGVDTWAVEAAKIRGMDVKVFLPNIRGCEKRYEYTRAFHARNKKIAVACDILVAFVSEQRRGGTENTIQYAKKQGKAVIIQHVHLPMTTIQEALNLRPQQDLLF